MAYNTNTTASEFTAIVRRIFIAFVMRQNLYTFAQISEEWTRLMDSGFDVTGATMGPDARREFYKELIRKGASFKMSRRNKMDLMLTLENAINHAVFEDLQYTLAA